MFYKMNYVIKEKIKAYKDRLLEFRLLIKEMVANRKIKTCAVEADYQGKILVIAHSLEKGMGLKNMRIGYGLQKAELLLNYLYAYLNRGYNTNVFAYQESLAILTKYLTLLESWNGNKSKIFYDFERLKKKFPLDTNYSLFDSGFHIFKSEELEKVSGYKFEEFLECRHSIRDYKDEIVHKEIVEKIVQLANMSPSACNRQAAKVYCTKNKQEAEYVDSIITGTNGFKKSIPNFAIITENRAYFTGAEQFQWYINGGIYVAYLSLAMHSLGLGNCIMQWFAFNKNEDRIKKYFEISENEAIVAVVGFGYCPKEVKYIAAQRKSVSETLIFKD